MWSLNFKLNHLTQHIRSQESFPFRILSLQYSVFCSHANDIELLSELLWGIGVDEKYSVRILKVF